MDYYAIIMATIAGAIGGAIIGVYGINKKDKTKKNKKGMFLGIVLFSVINGVSKMPQIKTPIMSLFDEHYAFKAEIGKKMAFMTDILKLRLS